MDDRTLRVLEFPKIRDRLVALTVTAAGREIAVALQPSANPEVVRKSLQETGEAVALLVDGGVPLRGTSDIREMLHRAQIGSPLSPQEFLAIRATAATTGQCRASVQARKERVPLLAEIARGIRTFESLEATIRRTVADDGMILDTASQDLARIRREQRTVHRRIHEKLEELLRGPYGRMLQDLLITTRGDRYVVPVKQEFKGQFPGIFHDQSASGASVFMEPLTVLPLGNQLRELEVQEREEVSRLLRDLTAQVATVAQELGSAYEALGRIDFAVAKAQMAEAMRATAPRVRTDGALRFNQARHPLLDGEVVPIDVWLGEEFTTLVITGPNTGGKTVTLKTVGLLTLMAQAGLYIPTAEGSEVAGFPQVFADIGDEQSIEQSLSTFSSHMGAIVGIMGQIRGPALVLLDEIGAGTDPTEGVALARAVIEYLHARGLRTAVTTHYNELKALAYTNPGIRNASVEFDPQTLRPTYRLLIGLPGRSNALTIAARLGLDTNIIERARTILGPEAMTIDRILSDLEADRKAYEWELAEAARLRREADALRARYQEDLDSLREERKKILSRLREEAQAQIARTRREVESIIKALKSSQDAASAREARARLSQLAEEVEALTESSTAVPGEVITKAEPGQHVFIVPLNRVGTVLAPADTRGEVEVDSGSIRVKVQLSALRAVTGEVPPAAVTHSGLSWPSQAVPLSINLRGEKVEDAIPEVDKYLDDAYLAGLQRVTVIHGKGTGALRKAIHEFLRSHPHVRSFRLGGRGEGESGATIVELEQS